MPADEKTEKATPKRRQDERKKGNVFQSNDVAAVCHQGNSREASGQEVPGIDCDGAVVGMGSVGIIGIVPVGDDLALSAVPFCGAF